MRKLLLLVLTLSASASPLLQDEHLPDHVVKEDVLPAIKKELTVHLAETEEAPLKQDEGLLEPETKEEHKHIEEASVLLEEPELNTDYLTEEAPETELQAKTQLNTNPEPVEEPVEEPVKEPAEEPVEVPVESQSDVYMQVESENVLEEEPTLQADYIVVEQPEVEINPGREQQMALKNERWTCRGFILQGKCYQFFTRRLYADAAELQCQQNCPNGHLASVTSSLIRDEIGKLMRRYGGLTSSWIGGRRTIGTNAFTWLDGSPWSFNGWSAGEPNNSGGQENCVEILSNLRFNDVPCSISKPIICTCPV